MVSKEQIRQYVKDNEPVTMTEIKLAFEEACPHCKSSLGTDVQDKTSDLVDDGELGVTLDYKYVTPGYEEEEE